MTDERTESGMQPGRGYDDDRLLAFALGLDDDPELVAAVEHDAGLSARLTAMFADVDRIGAQVRAAVPAPEDGYTDLSGARWSGLNEYFEAPVSPARPRRERRWWRIAVPVIALAALALVAGIVAVDQSGRPAGTESSADVARSGSEAVPEATAEAMSPDASVVTATEPAPATPVERLAAQLDRFAIIVLARARAATGALQRFAVVRIFKGDAPQVVELEVDDQPADMGRLHLLMLDPTPAPGQQFESPEPFPSPATAAGDFGYGTPLSVSYTYHGEPTMVREFAAGTDPDLVSLPIP
jgi:hypothetical protein